MSLALSDHFPSKGQLAQDSLELCAGKSVSVPFQGITQADDALKDPQFLTILGVQQAPPSGPVKATQSSPSRLHR
ncbi:hypothetical protein D3C85_1711350 [compost metagenome]